MSNPNVCVLKTDGINCDKEMAHAFETAGAIPETVHVNQLRSGETKLADFAILAIPGGFSYGDDIASGKVLANEMTSFLSDQLHEFAEQRKPILGICNGFQVLVRTGLLPNRTVGYQTATLAENEIGRFDCRWINLAAEMSVCKFLNDEDFAAEPIPMQTAHGEGKFFAEDRDIDRLIDNNQVVFRYTKRNFARPDGFPDNPNGAIDNIAGICDETGSILGMMPHPERSIEAFHPHRVRTVEARRAARLLFDGIVQYAQEL